MLLIKALQNIFLRTLMILFNLHKRMRDEYYVLNIEILSKKCERFLF